jgi:hypothetical protein
MAAKKSLLPSPAARQAQRSLVDRRLLRFLREHIYSTLPILQQVAGYTSPQGIRQAVQRLEKLDLVRQHTLIGPGQRLKLWGITHNGQGMAFALETEHPVTIAFEPSKLAYSTVPHHLDLQLLRVKAEAVGWTEWQHGDRLGSVDKDGKRPDAVALDISGKRVAVECERTMKAPQRYKSILSSYLQAIRAGQFTRVVWVSPTEDISQRVKKIILSISQVPVAGKQVAVDPARHHQNLQFTFYQEWPNV